MVIQMTQKWNNAIYEKNWKGYLDLDQDGLSKIQKLSKDTLASTDLIESVTICQESFKEKTIKLKVLGKQGSIHILNGDAQFMGFEFFFHVEESGCMSPNEFVSQLEEKLRSLFIK